MALEGILSGVGVEILKKLSSQASAYLGRRCGVKDDLDKLRSNVKSIQAVLRVAEQLQGNDHSLTDWLEKLGDVFYDVEDVLDEISTEALRREVMTRGKNAKQVRIFFSNSNQLAFSYRMACQVKKINERLDVISQEKEKFHFNNPVGIQNVLSYPKGMQRNSQSSLRVDQKIFGRVDDMNNLKKKLLAEDDKVKANVSFIAIVGMGGIGKTTLAKSLYNDKQVSDCFETRIWIWVSHQFDTKTILGKIIESATVKKPKVDELEPLNTKLQEVIGGKKYLLVMDDVWNENENEWENLKSSLMHGARGSKVLITKRDSKAISRIETIPLKDLTEDSSWLLFKEMAFEESDLESTNQNLIKLGKEISKKCGGIPLVIRHIGRLLNGKTSVEYWEFIKENDLLNVTREENNNDGHVISTLKLSYNHLSPNLKQCFAYSSLFPKEYRITPTELIGQWIAQGFIESSNEGKSVEDIGKEYLNELCWRFFFEITSTSREFSFEDNELCCMHDVMRDLAREVAGKKLYVRGDPNNEYVVSEQTRHISFEYVIVSWKDVLSKLHQAKGLRTFLSLAESPITNGVLDRLVSNFPRLRVLQIFDVSKSIKKLRHLRYLKFTRMDAGKSLPNCITELQTLDLTDCFSPVYLPRDIKNLVNLRYLLSYSKYIDAVEIMEKLTSLQTIRYVLLDCKKFDKVKKFSKMNCSIESSLQIIGLEQLRFFTSRVKLVNLKNKRVPHVKLEFKNDNTYDGDDDETILEGFEPHRDVKCLDIEGYCGVGLPNWVSTLHLLTEVFIKNCDRLQHLNQLSHLQALKMLHLWGLKCVMMSISEWIVTLTSLEVMDIRNCWKLKSLPKEMQQLKCLRKLRIYGCPELKERCKEGGQDWPNISHIPELYLHF
ncbi:hypothetical protein IC582_002283 [Cucumis melo]|uniref:Disease resistance protein RGA2-like n=1 Tax=Cucumis melo TaxID=3656 RepID=A0A1S4E360_CUCME|nr:disease resistance protein RGA2-like [Cucumis melo]